MNKPLKGTALLLAAVFAAGLLAAPVAEGKSLWSDEKGSWSLYSDRKAHGVGDILTILISERTTNTTSKSNSNEKSGNVDLGVGTGLFSFLKKATGANYSDNFEANGSSTATNRSTGNITVTVMEVEPNGNMIVEGTQSIWQNKDEHKITLRGIVRQDDVSVNNTVPSTKVADATVHFDGKGPLNAKQRQGILTQIFNILF